jgi:F0F1-type ATP synthase assembly protein I
VSEDEPPGGPDSRRFFGDVLTFGWVLPAAIAAGAGLGYLGDRVLGIFPVLTATLGALGFAAGLRQIYRESGMLVGGGKGRRD